MKDLNFNLKTKELKEIKLSAPQEYALQQAWLKEDLRISANRYKEQRASAYPSVQQQLDMIYHQGIDAWKAKIKLIKDTYPKPV